MAATLGAGGHVGSPADLKAAVHRLPDETHHPLPRVTGRTMMIPAVRDVAVNPDSIGSLFLAAADGDAAAWKALVERLAPLVWSVVRAHNLSDADGHEVYQTTWLRLAQHLDRIREPDSVGSWLASTARHECLKLIKVSRRVFPVGDPEVFDRIADERTPEEALLRSEEAEAGAEKARQLWQAFEQLGEACQRLLRVLMASPRPQYNEVSAALGIPVGGIGPTRQRCLRRLRTLLAERGVR
ncbi:MAG: sle [Sphaerisporangium sp.]|nr:sle [Sphaerisporangium sp.]